MEVKIYSINGVLLFHRKYAADQELTVNSNLRKGTYVVQMISGEGATSDLVSVF